MQEKKTRFTLLVFLLWFVLPQTTRMQMFLHNKNLPTLVVLPSSFIDCNIFLLVNHIIDFNEKNAILTLTNLFA